MSYLETLGRQLCLGTGVLDGDLALFGGWIQTESAWKPNAIRFEPAFLKCYVEPLHIPDATEEMLRACSFGLGQMMGQVAREFGFEGQYLTELLDPAVNLELAVEILMDRHRIVGSWDGALAAYNGGLGGNRRPPYRNQSYVNAVHANARSFA